MTKEKSLIEIRWHGRGGQGAVTSAEMLAQAAISEGKYAQAFPASGRKGGARRCRLSTASIASEPVRIRAEITEPDVVVVLDPGLLGYSQCYLRSERGRQGHH